MKIQPFRFSISPLAFAQIEADWLVIPVIAEQPATPTLRTLDRLWQGELSTITNRGDFAAKLGELLPIHRTTGIAAKRVLLVGCGQYASLTRATLHHAIACAFKAITTKPWDQVAMTRLVDAPLGIEAEILGFAGGIAQGAVGPGFRKREANRFIPHDVTFIDSSIEQPLTEALLQRASIEANAVSYARELVNLPPNELTPDSFSARAGSLDKQAIVDIWDEKRLQQERMGAVLAVGRGATNAARFVMIKHLKGGNSPTLALVGKGVTFDSGGLSIKTTDQMVDMKCDMAGAAAVLATMKAIIEMKAAVNVVAYIPLVENMPSGDAMRLGDIIVARNGKTIEVLNTDAEGRLILADALSLAVEDKVAHIVDLATLTGACMIALGTQIAGLMGNHAEWIDRVKTAITRAGERAWQLPMDADFEELLPSKIADLKNTPQTRYGGAIAAAKFLEQFVGKTPWVHLDIAGPAWAERDSAAREAGGTGAYVHSLIELVLTYGK